MSDDIETPEVDDNSTDTDDLPTRIFTADGDDHPIIDDDPDDDSKDPDKKDPTKKDDTGDDDFKTRFDKLEENYARASRHIEDLNKGISKLRKENHELRRSGAAGDGEDSVFTDAQLLAIMEENKDDPGVMLQAMKQLIKQANVDTQKITDKKVELASKRGEVDSIMGNWKPYIEKNQDTIDKVVEYHDLSDHPFKEHLALGAMLVAGWPKMVESIKEEAKKEALGGKVDYARRKSIKDNKPDIGGNDATPGDGDIQASWIESADRLGLPKSKRKAYFDLMMKSSKKKG